MARNKFPENRYVWWRMGLNIYDYKMIKLESEPGGYEFEVILLKLFSHACSNEGYLALTKGEDGEVDYVTLSKVLRHDINIVKKAIKYFYENGFLTEAEETQDAVLVYFPEMKYRVGDNTSYEADRRRYKRRLEGKERGVQLELDIAKSGAYSGVRGNVRLTEKEYQELQNRYSNSNIIIDNLSIWLAKNDMDVPDHFAWCLNFGNKDGVIKKDPKEAEVKKRERQYILSKQEASIGGKPDSEARRVLTKEQIDELDKLAEEVLAKEKSEREEKRSSGESKEIKELDTVEALRKKHGIKI